MKQIVQSARTGRLAIRDVPEPQVRAGHLLVQTRASLISAGTERMVVDFARKSLAAKAKARPDLVKKVLDKARRDGIVATFQAVLARLDEPMPLGYSAAGVVMAVGKGLEGQFHVGQRVAVAGAGLANHAELNSVPRNLAAPIPDGIDDEEACFGTLAAIAMHGVRNLSPQLGDVVAVIGVGLVGQIASQLLALAGCRVLALDYNEARLALAKSLGAEQGLSLESDGLDEAVRAMTRGLGCDSVLIAAATDSSAPLEIAAQIARDRARISLVGKTGTEFPFADFMKKELSVVVSRSYGPGRYDEDFEGRGMKYPPGFVRWTESENLAECVRLMGPGLIRRLDMKALITHRFDFLAAEDAYSMVMGNTQPHLGVVLTYPDVPIAPVARPVFAQPKAAAGHCTLGVVGAGAFARTVLLPALKKMPDVRLHTLVTQRGLNAEHGQQSYGFSHCATDAELVFANPEINAVLIATRHANHAEMVSRALAAGKCVFVEKPLAVDRAQLAQVITARQGSAGFFTVGFNRRFAPMSESLRRHFAGTAGPRVATLRVNAGAMPAESWVNAAEEGGGRMVGEMCHFIDLARSYVGQPITKVRAECATPAAGAADDLAVTLHFADGSLANIVYTALGDTAYSKERFEVFAGGKVATIDNFLSLGLVSGGTIKTEKARAGQDKGHAAELRAFAQAVTKGGPAPIEEAELIETAEATIAVAESLRLGETVAIGGD
ncbi:bi-domain-containing oxidoreductase [Magnetospirillum sp. 15-1]|uniref:bi-domain-containing oxidoreductase n=1 Tax=Magnetospirillum sp. 15-1 TaxID=1979370 RepID=UPI000BBCF29B|nr:bi-domain-containing oxidoreductase [Magnetospirillum sp. 15-1]